MAKTELEQAGEDTDGMVESTAKLRDLIKGISGVDIMIDENNFKSTYQIISELGKVWNNIKDVDQASLLEAIAGKRQSNIVAAALTNYERLDDVLQMSIDSMGSAREEHAEYTKSIQYSINTLKAAYQDFADSVINSDFVKTVLSGAQSFLEILTKIIDKFGTLPTILTAIAGVRGLRGKGIFGGFSDISKLFSSRASKNLLSSNNILLQGVSQNDLNSLQRYADLLGQGVDESEAFDLSLKDASDSTKGLASGINSLYLQTQNGTISMQQYNDATQNLSQLQRNAAVSSKILDAALKAIGNIAFMVAINAAIKGISYLIDKLVVTKEELAEIRQESVQSMSAFASSLEELEQENEEIDNLVTQYKELINSTADTSENKQELLQIQSQLVEAFGDENNSLDLLNDSYDTTISKVKELNEINLEKFKIKNADAIAEAEEYSNAVLDLRQLFLNAENTGLNPNPSRGSVKNAVKDMGDLYASLYLIEDVSEKIQDIQIDGLYFSDGFWGNDLVLSGDVYDAYNQLYELIKQMKDAGASKDELTPLTSRLSEFETILNSIDKYSAYFTSNQQEFTSVVIGNVKEALNNLKDLNAAMGNTRDEWFKNLDEIESGVGKDVESIISALQKLAEGDNLSSSDFWDIMELDTDKIVSDIQMVGDSFVVSEEQLIALKDQYVNQQIDSLKLENDNLETKKQTLSTTLDEAKAELSLLGARGMANAAYREEYQDALNTVKQAEANLEDYGDQIKRNNILIEQWKSKLGDVVDRQKQLTDELKKVQDYADNLLKAQEYKIDQIISGHEAEKDALEAEKEALQDELDVLNDQKDAIEEIIDKYDTVNNYIQKVVKDEIDAVKEQQKAIEDSYNKRIDALKAENEEREDALEYAEKLANLENAKRNKRYVLDETRGWRYESVKEDVVKAQNDLANFETSREIKNLEKERDKEVAVYDDIIDRKEKYLKQWEDIPDAIKDEQDELLAQELFGADVRERITNEDISLLETFDASYRKHNTDLRIITGTEIKLKQAAIDAKDAEIKSKDEQINKWKAYKTEVQNAAKDIKDATEDYLGLLNTVTVDENSSLETRTTNLNNFKDAYSNALQTAIDLQSQLDSNGGSYEYDVHVNGLDELKQAAAAGAVIAATAGMASTGVAALGVGGAMAIANSPIAQTTNDIVDVISEIMNKLNGYSQGGVADYTGMAMLHGRKNAPETIFNASDSAKLYDMVHNTPNLMADMLDKAVKISGFNLANTGNTNNTSTNLSFHIDKIVADNPEDFAKQLDRYYQTKLTQSYTSRQ